MSHLEASVTPSADPAGTGLHSGAWRRFGFRFLALYLALYNVPRLISPIPVLNYLSWLDFQVWRKMVPWAGREILHLPNPITVLPNGSGDTTYNYVQILCLFLVTLGGTLIWLGFDRKRRYDPFVLEVVRAVVRYTLGITMVNYGMMKMLHLQMPAPTLHQLVMPYSDFSPMGLLWRFMGFSPAYSFFAGFGEFVGGGLLFFRRTTTVGSLILSAVLFHVVLMNFCFDVPVKIYSSHLLVFALFLAAPDYRRLFDVLIRHRAVAAASFMRCWPRAWMKSVAIIIKAAVIAVLFYQIPLPQFKGWLKSAERPELYGLYDVKEFKVDGVAPTTPGAAQWQRLFITEYGVTLEYRNTRREYFTATSSLKEHKLVFKTHDAPPQTTELTVGRSEPDVLMISGIFHDHQIAVELYRVDETRFILLSRGFHWINEHPYNR